ncbi:4'-phosphopantetheinyl transferase family protein [Nonomuraea sp. NPDC050540]|uniref:4'-phosphopantetheinyl transferase family protein n=1 Tax=Nonomuraea sp. NPDC050540 TaxID=3364367 RepID=UPI0037B9EFAC
MGARPEQVHAPAAWLTDVERARSARFVHEADRRAFVAAHLLVRLSAAACLDADPATLTLLQYCEIHGEGHGRPYLKEFPGLGVSLSHTRGYVAAAAGPGKVGVDAERVPPGAFDTTLAAQIAAPTSITDNTELIRLWARKEALIKRGELSLDTVRAPIAWDGHHVLEWREPPDVVVVAVTDVKAERVPHGREPSW